MDRFNRRKLAGRRTFERSDKRPRSKALTQLTRRTEHCKTNNRKSNGTISFWVAFTQSNYSALAGLFIKKRFSFCFRLIWIRHEADSRFCSILFYLLNSPVKTATACWYDAVRRAYCVRSPCQEFSLRTLRTIVRSCRIGRSRALFECWARMPQVKAMRSQTTALKLAKS